MGYFTIGYWAPEINDWYFNGEFETHGDAMACGRNTAAAKGARVRVTNQETGHVDYIDPPDPVLIDVRQLASGTVARLCGSVKYDDIDAYRAAFMEYVAAHPGFETWQDAHEAYKNDTGGGDVPNTPQ